MKVGYKKRGGKKQIYIPGQRIRKIRFQDKFTSENYKEQEIKIPITKEEIEKLKTEIEKKRKEI